MDEALIERLVRMETKLDLVLTRAEDHEVRLRALEERKWPLGPLGTVIGGLGVAAGFFSVLLTLWSQVVG